MSQIDPTKFRMADPERPMPLGSVIWFGSLKFMYLGYGYDMVLLPPRAPTDSDSSLSSSRRNRRPSHHGRRSHRTRRGGPLPHRAADTESLARDLSGISLATEGAPAVRSANLTSAYVEHSAFLHGLHSAATDYASSASTDLSAYVELPGHHLRSTLDLIATMPTSEYVDSAEDTDSGSGPDFTNLLNPGATRYFLDACDYYFGVPNSDFRGRGVWPDPGVLPHRR